MKDYLKRLTAFGISLWLVLMAFDIIISKILKDKEDGYWKTWAMIHSGEINADIIIQGSSRAWVHVSPPILEDKLKKSTWNLGINACNFPIQKLRYDLYLAHNQQPEVIIHCLDLFSLQRRDVISKPQFLPYFYNMTVRDELRKYRDMFSIVDFYVPMYRYRSEYGTILNALLSFCGLKKSQNLEANGYRPQERAWDSKFKDFVKANPNGREIILDDELITEFDKYLADAKRIGINVVLVYPPELREAHKYTTNRKEIMTLYDSLSSKHGLTFIDYSDDPICDRKELFYNSQHLNKTGAELFSAKLASDIALLLPGKQSTENTNF